MAYQAIAVRQVKTFALTAQAGTSTVTPDNNVAAGSTLVVIGGALDTASADSCRLTSASDSALNTWGSPTNVRAAESYKPNAFACVAENVAAGKPTVTLNWNAATSNAISGVLIEVEKCVTASGVDKTVTGTAESGSSTSTAATGTLTQTDNLAILCAAGWFGTPSNPAGWTNVLNQSNGVGGAIGCQVSYKNVTTTASITGTVTSETIAGSSAILLVIKAVAAGAALRYKFLLDSATFTDADTGITGYVWRNMNPEDGAAEKYTGLAGDSSGQLLITGTPVDVDLGDTIIGSFFNDSDGSRPFVAGTVEVDA